MANPTRPSASQLLGTAQVAGRTGAGSNLREVHDGTRPDHGSAEGLGLMAGQLLVGEGHEVVLHARNPSRADDARAALPDTSDSSSAISPPWPV